MKSDSFGGSLGRSFSGGTSGGAVRRRKFHVALATACVSLCLTASDHSDVPQVNGVTRQDANLTDLHAFVVGENLVLSLCSNPAIPKSASSYIFPSDVTFEINLDNHSAVSSLDPDRMGGTILEPDKTQEDITFRIAFDEG